MYKMIGYRLKKVHMFHFFLDNFSTDYYNNKKQAYEILTHDNLKK